MTSENEQAVREAAERRAQEGDSFGSDVIRVLDAKDAEIAELKSRLEGVCDNYLEAEDDIDAVTRERDTALSRAEQAEAENAQLRSDIDDLREIAPRGTQVAIALRKRAEQAEAALAEMRVAMAEAVRRGNEHIKARPDQDGIIEDTIAPLSRFILPAKPAVDPLVECLEQALMTDTKDGTPQLADNLRAAIERAGGTISFERNGDNA